MNPSNNKFFIFREMMFGNKDEFEYFECGECGCLQVNEIPRNLSKFYADNYFSFKQPASLKDNFIKAFFKYQRAQFFFYKKNIFGSILLKFYRPPDYFEWLKRVNIKFESEILDVGCGSGELLVRMKKDGFLNLTGIDPFIKDNIYYKNGVNILKKELSEIDHQFDFIMLHHSFEHMPDPLSALKELYRILKTGGYVLIRVPVASSYAWEKYGRDWVQLDPPRHLFLHTVKSMNLLAEQAGFEQEEILFDSTEFQFWGSEQQRQGIPLKDRRSLAENPKNSIFTQKQIKAFKARAKELNKKQIGDQACFYLYKL